MLALGLAAEAQPGGGLALGVGMHRTRGGTFEDPNGILLDALATPGSPLQYPFRSGWVMLLMSESAFCAASASALGADSGVAV